MSFQPVFVPGGVYLRTATGEIIGQLDNPGAPFATLAEARDHADWLEMVVQFQQTQSAAGLAGDSALLAARGENSGRLRTVPGREKQLVPHDVQEERVSYE